jgi:hypothetical protein
MVRSDVMDLLTLTPPSKIRRCERCRIEQSDGKYLGLGIFPMLTPGTNLMPTRMSHTFTNKDAAV